MSVFDCEFYFVLVQGIGGELAVGIGETVYLEDIDFVCVLNVLRDLFVCVVSCYVLDDVRDWFVLLVCLPEFCVCEYACILVCGELLCGVGVCCFNDVPCFVF